MLTTEDIKGIYVPVITPFDQKREVDYSSYRRLLDSITAADIDGLVINGTTAESPTVSMDEVREITEFTLRIVRDALGNRDASIPIVVGTGTNDTASSVKRTELAGSFGADAALIVVPYYSRPSQEGIIAHFREIAQVGVPIIAYDIPSRTGVGMTVNTAKSILALDGVIGLKDSSGSLKLISDLSRWEDCKPILCGEDELLFSMLCNGAKGGMTASANVQAGKYVQLYKSFIAGDFVGAKATSDQLLPLIQLLFKESNPGPIKWLLKEQGIIETDTLRLPMTSISSTLQQELELCFSFY